MKTRAIVVAVSAAIFGACATPPEKIQSASVSTLQYDSYNCRQIAMELDRVNTRANELYASLKKLADDDSAQMAVGMILLWPALFFLEGGDGPQAAEYAKLKGEKQALEKTAVQKQCGIQVTAQDKTQAPDAASDAPASLTPTAPSSTAVPVTAASTPPSIPVAAATSNTAAAGPAAKTGKHWLSAAQFGRSQDCEPSAPPQLITETGDAEVYQIACNGKSMPLLVKCSGEQCNGI